MSGTEFTVQQILDGQHRVQKVDRQPQPILDVSDLTTGQIVGLWLDTRAQRSGKTYTAIIYNDYVRFCESLGADWLPLRMFGYALRLLDVEKRHTAKGTELTLSLRRVSLPPGAPRRPPADQGSPPPPPRPSPRETLRRLGLR